MSNTLTLNATDVIEAMRSVQTEGDRWNLAEALKVQVPTGLAGFAEIIDQATAAGVAGNLSANTLRLYRDTATRWPADRRVANVSFSAHREAMALPSIDAAVKMLEDLSKNLGPSKVTVASIRKAVAVQQGRTPTTASPAPSQRAVDILADVKVGAPQLIAAILPTTEAADLDKLHAGLTKAISHVERLRAKAARNAASAAKKSGATAGKTSTTATAKPSTRKAQGDLRGM